MAVKMYKVLKDQKYTGKHKVYIAGQEFPESELFGNEENIKMALEGGKGRSRKITLVKASQKKADSK